MSVGNGSPLPPSRFSAGYTSGAPVAGGAGSGPGSPAPPTQDSNVLATISFVLVLLFGVFAVPVTMPMAVVAKMHAERSAGAGAGRAVANAALVVGAIYLVIGVAAIALWFAIPHVTLAGIGPK